MQKFLMITLSYILFCILFITTVNALPIYQNYQETDIFTTKVKIGYFVATHYVDNYNLSNEFKGLNCAIEFNPLYATNITHNIYIGLNAYVVPTGKIQSNNVLFTLYYYLPFNIIIPDWMPKFDLYAGGGYAVRFTKIKEKLDIEDVYINKFGNAPVLGVGSELTYKSLKHYGISCYIDYKFMWFDIKSNIYNNTYNKYKNSFITIGIVYKSDFLQKLIL